MSGAEREVGAAAEEGRLARLGLCRNVLLLGAVSLLTDLSSEMSLTFLPFFLANVLGARTAVIGVIEGVADSTASLMRMASGWLSDVWGKRKGLLIAGYGLSALSKPLLFFASSWGAVMGVRFADRVGKGVRTSPRDALLAGSVRAECRGMAFGFHRGADTAGAFLGLVGVAVVVYLSQGWAQELQETAFRRLILVAAVPALLAVAVLLAVREAPAKGARPEAPGQGRGFACPARDSAQPRAAGGGLDRRFKMFLAAAGVFSLANSSDAFLLLRAQRLGLSVLKIALLLAAFNLVYSALSPLTGWLSDRWGRAKLIGAGWFIYAIAYLGFGMANAGWQIWPLFGLYAVYYGMAEGTARALVADLVQEKRRGTAYGMYNATVGVMALPASLIAGLVWEGIGPWKGWGPSAPFLLGAGLAGVGLVLLVMATRGLRLIER